MQKSAKSSTGKPRVRYGSIFRARPNGRSKKISIQSIIVDIFTVDDTVIIILFAFAAICSTNLCPHDVVDDADLHRVFESQFNYSM